MEMGPPPNEDITQDQTHPSSLLLHASKSESNLFSFHSDPNSRTCSLNTANSIHGISGIKTKIEEMVTSTPQAPSGPSAQNDDEKFRTPQRGMCIFPRSSNNSSSATSSGKKLMRSRSEITRTPSSGMRHNPFDSQISVDRLALPTCSPSVFSIVVSPGTEESSCSGQFWSLDQQARLFPAQISDDSPWKQEAMISKQKMDPELEDKTQEAIDLYFSQHHKVTSPEEVLPISYGASQRSMLMESVGNSPDLANENSRTDKHSRMDIGEEKGNSNSSSEANSLVINDSGQVNQNTQTWLSFPSQLPPDVEEMLLKYGLIEQLPTEGVKILEASSRPWTSKPNIVREESNISNSTLRRKLFAAMIPDEDLADESESDIEENDVKSPTQSELFKNTPICESTAMVISPGKVIMTPTSQRIPSPNKSLSWSLSPVSRKKRPNARTATPLGSSTPSRY